MILVESLSRQVIAGSDRLIWEMVQHWLETPLHSGQALSSLPSFFLATTD